MLLALTFGVASCGEQHEAPPEKTQVAETSRRVVALLDYVAADYGAAVKDGQVMNSTEYEVQVAFLADASELTGSLGGSAQSSEINGAIRHASEVVRERGAASQVATACRTARDLLLSTYAISLFPTRAPSFRRGAELYAHPPRRTAYGGSERNVAFRCALVQG